MTRFIIGVDGGQTSTVALLARADGEVVGIGTGGPANHIHEPGGMERMQRSLRDAVTSAFAQAGISSIQAESACFGMTGGMEYVPDAVSGFLQADILHVYHDVVTALAAASIAQPGIIVIAGTGAIVYGSTADQREARADGWGYFMGDEGSAYDIGLMVLRAAARAADGRGVETRLVRAVLRFWRKMNLMEVRAALYAQQISRAEIAGLSWVAYCAANGGDAVARNILADAGRKLGQTAAAVLATLGDNLPVFVTGGVFQAGDWVLEPFKATVRQTAPNVDILPSAFPQVVGALLLAQRAAGYPIGAPYLVRLRATLPAGLSRKTAAFDCADLDD